MKATILAPGSRGDVQPYIAIGQALANLGHSCTIVTTLDHEKLVRSYGLDLATIPLNVAEELRQVDVTRAVEGGGVLSSFRQFAAIARRSSRALAEVGLAACRDADVIVTNFGTVLVADALSHKLGIPVVQAYNVPVTPAPTFPGALFPQLDFGTTSRRIGHWLTRQALWLTGRTAAQEACAEVLGAKRASVLAGADAGFLPGPLLYGFSAAFLPPAQGWPPAVHVTGFWFTDDTKSFTPPVELARFLDDGPPPVYIGFGSMSTEKPEEVSALVLDAAKRSRTRVVLLSGWGGLSSERAGADVFVLSEAPHAWLFPRCSAVVHHGGAGTTAATVRAGVPAVVVPFHGDQPFWADRVHGLGLGPAPIPRRSLDSRRLSAAITLATTRPEMRERAAAVGRLVREEQGALNAARYIMEASRGSPRP